MQRTGLDKSEKNRSGVPDPKKLERTGEKSFVIHADGGNYFEGVVTDPNVKLKSSGRVAVTNDAKQIVNLCSECANNKYHNEGVMEVCDSCEKHNHFKLKVKNVSSQVSK